jgi:hypothetical protein
MSTLESVRSVPFAREDWVHTVTVGTLATLAAAAAPVVLLVLVGYVTRLFRAGRGTFASFEGVGGLVRDGLRVAAVVVPLHLPAVALLAVTVGTHRLRYLAPTVYGEVTRGVLPSLGTVASLLAAVGLEVVAGYLSVALAAVVSRRRSVGAVRSPDVARLATSRRFLRAVSIAAAAVTASRLLAGVAALLPVAGAALSAAVTFLAVVVAASYVSRSVTAVLVSAAGPRKRPAGTASVADDGREFGA